MRLLSKLISNVSLVKPVEDKIVGLFPLKLRSHVACTVHSCKSQVSIIGFEVTSYLIIDNVWSPVFGHVPAQCRNPFLRANCWNGTIYVS